MIRPVSKSDTQQIVDIYNYYILNTIITFEINPINATEMQGRIDKTAQKYPWLVYEADGEIKGYAYATAWKPRDAYQNTVESTIYLKHGTGGKGIGSLLYAELISKLRQKKTHTILGGIGLPNNASIALHEKMGFRKVAHFKELGYKFDKWIDVAYWQLRL